MEMGVAAAVVPVERLTPQTLAEAIKQAAGNE
jgi:hypothetical protein